MDARGEYIAPNLSARQRDVFELIVRGRSNKEIARTLNLAEGTVKIHVAALFRKLGVQRRSAVAIAGGAISLPATGVPSRGLECGAPVVSVAGGCAWILTIAGSSRGSSG